MKKLLFKVKEGRLNTLFNWCHELKTKYAEEVLETLKEEKVTYESLSVFEINGVWFALVLSEGEGLPMNFKREVNMKHKQIKADCLEFYTELGTLSEFYKSSLI